VRADATAMHRSIANPIGLAASAPDYRLPPPALGEHDGVDWLPRTISPKDSG